MTTTEQVSLNKWLRMHIPLVDVMQPQSVHFDELLPLPAYPGPPETSPKIEDLYMLLEQVVELMGPSVVDIKPVVTLALPESQDVEHSIRQLDKYLQEHASCDEPPSIHLVSRAASLLPTRWEEYVYPLQEFDTRTTAGTPGLIYVYYRCYRWDEARRRSWEYARSIYFEYYLSATR